VATETGPVLHMVRQITCKYSCAHILIDL